MADDDYPTIEVGEDETELMVFLVTTRGVRMQPFPVLAEQRMADQVRLIRQTVAWLRQAAEKLEANADLAVAVDDIGEAMQP